MRTFVVPVYLAICVMTGSAACPRATAEEPVDYTHTLLLRRPLMEQELETQVGYRSGTGGREADATIALDIRLLPRWQIELAVPLLYIDPSGAPAEAGIGDLVLENKVLLSTPPESMTLRSGEKCDRDARRHLLQVSADRLRAKQGPVGDVREHIEASDLDAHPLTRRLTPFVELTTVTTGGSLAALRSMSGPG